MVAILTQREHSQSFGEEIANSVSHGIALLAALIAFPVLVISAVQHSDAAGITGTSIFAATLVLLYLASMLYHALPRNRAKRVFQILDHGAIYLLIAGTYTPFTLGMLRGAWGWTLFGLQWGLAVLGIVLKSVGGMRYAKLSVVVYLAMGWLVVIAIGPVMDHVPLRGLFWLMAGGLAYTAGVVFFALERIRYFHFVWHLFAIAGSACHFIAVLRYAA